MKRIVIYILILLADIVMALTKPTPVYVRNILARTVANGAFRLWFTGTCPPDPYPIYPWYKLGSLCEDARGSNENYAVFNIADSVLYRLSGGTVIVNTPGCSPLPNPWYPYDSLCNSTIGQQDIYATWYVLHLIDSILIVNPPGGVKAKIAPSFMTYAFSNTQIDTMPYKWVKDSGVITIPNIMGFKSLALGRWYDANGRAQLGIDTSGINTDNILVHAPPGFVGPAFSITFGRQGKLAPYPNTRFTDSVAEWQFQPWQQAGGNTDFIFRNGPNGWYLLPANRSSKDTIATLDDVRSGGASYKLSINSIPMYSDSSGFLFTNSPLTVAVSMASSFLINNSNDGSGEGDIFDGTLSSRLRQAYNLTSIGIDNTAVVQVGSTSTGGNYAFIENGNGHSYILIDSTDNIRDSAHRDWRMFAAGNAYFNATLPTGAGADNILVVNSTTHEVKQVTQASITGNSISSSGGAATQIPFYKTASMQRYSANFVWDTNHGNGTTGALFIGAPTTKEYFATTIEQGTNASGTIQHILRNTSNSASASTDFILENDVNDTTVYMDYGFNSSTNTQSAYTAVWKGGGYTYNNKGGYWMGTAAADTVGLFAGGTLKSNRGLYLDPSLVVHLAASIVLGNTVPASIVGAISYHQSNKDTSLIITKKVIGSELTDTINLGAWKAWTSTIVGFSATSTTTMRYSLVGKTCNVVVYIVGTSNATTFTFTLPFVPFSTFNANAICFNNGIAFPGIVSIIAGSNICSPFFFSTISTLTNTWTSTGDKECRVTLTYEIQ